VRQPFGTPTANYPSRPRRARSNDSEAAVADA